MRRKVRFGILIVKLWKWCTWEFLDEQNRNLILLYDTASYFGFCCSMTKNYIDWKNHWDHWYIHSWRWNMTITSRVCYETFKYVSRKSCGNAWNLFTSFLSRPGYYKNKICGRMLSLSLFPQLVKLFIFDFDKVMQCTCDQINLLKIITALFGKNGVIRFEASHPSNWNYLNFG